MLLWSIFLFFLFKQKTAYEMRISDWSSDVCSSDLALRGVLFIGHAQHGRGPVAERAAPALAAQVQRGTARGKERQSQRHRNAVGKTVEIGRASWGKSVSVRVDLGGRRIIKKKMNDTNNNYNHHRHTQNIFSTRSNYITMYK